MLDAENAAILKWLVGREELPQPKYLSPGRAALVRRLRNREALADDVLNALANAFEAIGSSRMKFALILAPRGRGRPRKNAGSIYEAHKDAAETEAAIEAQEGEGRKRLWGRGGSPGYVRAWRATANGLEGAAASATDTVLILDEFGQVDGREAGAVLYSLSNGGGKVRAARDGGMREPKCWRVMVLSTGEITVDSKLAEDRARKPRAGQLVRMLDIPADRGFGVFDHAGPDDDAGKLAKAFKQAAISAYGVAGPEFVRRLIDEQVTGDDVRGQVGEFVSAYVPAGADGQVDRAAQRLGLIATAGELATLLGVTPWREGEVAVAAGWALEQWISQRGGTEPAEARQAVEQVRRFIEAHGDSRFDPLDNPEAKPSPNRAGWRKGEGLDREWLIPSETWRNEICAGLDPKFVARTLGDAGILRRASDGFQQVRRIGGTLKRVFVIGAAIFDGGGHEG
jgi:putative DNA primase/helicase